MSPTEGKSLGNGWRDYRWCILSVVSAGVFVQGVNYQCIPPILSTIIGVFALSHAQAGLLMSFNMLPGILIAVPSGMLIDRYGAKLVGSIALALVLIGGLITVIGPTYDVIAVGRFMSGIGARIFIVLAAVALTMWFHDKEIGLAMGVFNAMFPLAAILSLTFLGQVGMVWGWRSPLWVPVVLTSLVLCLFIILFRLRDEGGPSAKTSTETDANEPRQGVLAGFRMVSGRVWLMAISWMAANMALTQFISFGPDFFISTGKTVQEAGMISGSVMWGAVTLGVVAGIIIDRLAINKRVLVATGAVFMTICFFLVPFLSNLALPLMVIVGAGLAVIPTTIYALLSEVLPRRHWGMGFGIFSTCFNIGCTIAPYLAGIVRDVTGSYIGVFMMMTFFALMSAVTILMVGTKRADS